MAFDRWTEQVRDHRSEEKPPDFERAIESGKVKRFDGESLVR